MKRFDEKVVLITGGRSGIGAACAHRFAEEGARVFTAQRTASDDFETVKCDFSDTTAVHNVVNTIIDKTGRLNVLVNNAGIMDEATVAEASLEDWQRTIDVNLTAPFILTKTAMPHLKKTGGAIVNIGSIEGIGSNPRHPAYGASKAGLHGLTRAVAVDHGKDGVRCNAVAPGWIDTPLNEDFIASMPDPTGFRAQLGTIHPVGRTGQPEEVANLVVWLASNEASFVSGQIFVADGGRTAQLSLP